MASDSANISTTPPDEPASEPTDEPSTEPTITEPEKSNHYGWWCIAVVGVVGVVILVVFLLKKHFKKVPTA